MRTGIYIPKNIFVAFDDKDRNAGAVAFKDDFFGAGRIQINRATYKRIGFDHSTGNTLRVGTITTRSNRPALL